VKKKIFISLLTATVIAAGLFFFYFNNTNLSNPTVRTFYNNLKDTLRQKGYSDRLLVISTKRAGWHNDIQVWLSGAAKESRHLNGDAIDFIVFDINRDGKANKKNVTIVFNIQDQII
jgi:hypothetical protein